MNKKHIAKPILSNPIEPYPGLTVSDLNRYLPALQKIDDIDIEQLMTDRAESFHDGMCETYD